MTSSRPYIMRSLYEWILDNECTPYVLVNAMDSGAQVPQQYVKDGQIVLNISPLSVIDLSIDNDAMSFNGRFGGIATDVYVPTSAVIGIYARENGQGMVFDEDTNPEPPPSDPEQPPTLPRKPSLKVVK
ncbi:ClpXP protease specificity-enhancing factor [Halieaceae bacterium IMCC14734]|uniref:ClpXP protease specificity-enhancing factor n=2 Tax=Candidatus Litorirhabdus singularis TaxID=2518993 RepID=A0ABT3TJD0_9GAMM|nr:ClpXP protease specificity-enhancing factor [Candidatus Litorirhabdus singularis]